MPTGGGGGGGGLATVTTNATLTGAGTSGSPLSVNGWPVTFYQWGGFGTNNGHGGANGIECWGVVLYLNITFSNLIFKVTVADNTNNSDLGIYTAAGALKANIGPQTFATTGDKIIATLQGSQTLPAGLYVFAFTGSADTLRIASSTNSYAWVNGSSVTTSSSATLPNNIAVPAASPVANNVGFGLS